MLGGACAFTMVRSWMLASHSPRKCFCRSFRMFSCLLLLTCDQNQQPGEKTCPRSSAANLNDQEGFQGEVPPATTACEVPGPGARLAGGVMRPLLPHAPRPPAK